MGNSYNWKAYSNTVTFSTKIGNFDDYPDEALCPRCDNVSGSGFYFIAGLDNFREDCTVCLGTGLDPAVL